MSYIYLILVSYSEAPISLEFMHNFSSRIFAKIQELFHRLNEMYTLYWFVMMLKFDIRYTVFCFFENIYVEQIYTGGSGSYKHK